VLTGATDQLYDNESSAVGLIGRVRGRLARLGQLDRALADFAEQLDKAEIQLSETIREIRGYLDRTDFDPADLEQMQERLDFLLGLERRYQMPIDELKIEAEKWAAELDSLVFEDEERGKLVKPRGTCLKKLRDSALRLSRARRDAAEVLDKQVTTEIEQLMLVGARFRTQFGYEEDSTSDLVVDERPIRPRSDGIDDVVFHIRTNPGEAEGSVIEVASSGELSRIALALKSVVSIGREGSVLVFDELDAGVGADMGEVIASKLEMLGRSYQIVCITHMPQIAVRGESHLVVKKVSRDERTYTRVEPSTGIERIEEIARMLGGREGSQKRLALAKEMLQSKKRKLPINVRP
jgi:DNA repair protein RecN (Recombination protein N)